MSGLYPYITVKYKDGKPHSVIHDRTKQVVQFVYDGYAHVAIGIKDNLPNEHYDLFVEDDGKIWIQRIIVRGDKWRAGESYYPDKTLKKVFVKSFAFKKPAVA